MTIDHIELLSTRQDQGEGWPEDVRGEGWLIFETWSSNHAPFEIQRIDLAEGGEPQLDNDATAWRIVVSKAAAGSEPHVRTLAFLAMYSIDELLGIASFFWCGEYRNSIPKED